MAAKPLNSSLSTPSMVTSTPVINSALIHTYRQQPLSAKAPANRNRHSIIRALSPIISTAFDVRVTRKRVLNGNDQLRWRMHQPLKVEHGAMTLHYATWRNATQLLYGTQTLDLTPSSRALHFSVDYETPFLAHTPRSALTLSASYVKDPNHSHYNKNTWLAALRLHVPF